ncbi:hypothetical protein EV361DRAFT_863712 [Lentinula raphanica]|nr:hypothetical protein EV361DRAFT_863712 [Lentinula raphanica]
MPDDTNSIATSWCALLAVPAKRSRFLGPKLILVFSVEILQEEPLGATAFLMFMINRPFNSTLIIFAGKSWSIIPSTVVYLSVALVIAIPLPVESQSGASNPVLPRAPREDLQGIFKTGYIVWDAHDPKKYNWVKPTADPSNASKMLCFEQTCFGYNRYTSKVEKAMMRIVRSTKGKIEAVRVLYRPLAAVTTKSRFTAHVRDALYEELMKITKGDIESESLPIDEQVPIDEKCIRVMLRRAQKRWIILKGYDQGAPLEENMKAPRKYWSTLRLGSCIDPDSGKNAFQVFVANSGTLLSAPNCICPQLLGKCYCHIYSETTKASKVHEIEPKRLENSRIHPVLVPRINGEEAHEKYETHQLEAEIKKDLTDTEALKQATGIPMDDPQSPYIPAMLTLWKMKEFLAKPYDSTDLDFEKLSLTSLIRFTKDHGRADVELGDKGRDRTGEPLVPAVSDVELGDKGRDHTGEPLVPAVSDVELGDKGRDHTGEPQLPVPTVFDASHPNKLRPSAVLRPGVFKIGNIVWDEHNPEKYDWVKPTKDLSNASKMLCILQTCFGYNRYTEKIEQATMKTRTGHAQKPFTGFYSSLAVITNQTRFTDEVRDALFQEFRTKITKYDIQYEFPTKDQIPIDEKCIHIMLRRAQRRSLFKSGYDPNASLEANMANPTRLYAWSALRFGHYNLESEKPGFQIVVDKITRELKVDEEPNCICPILLAKCYCLMRSKETKELKVHAISSTHLGDFLYHPTLEVRLNGDEAGEMYQTKQSTFEAVLEADLMDIEKLKLPTGSSVDSPQSHIRAVLTLWKMKGFLTKSFDSTDFEKSSLTSLIQPGKKRKGRADVEPGDESGSRVGEPPRKKAKTPQSSG